MKNSSATDQDKKNRTSLSNDNAGAWVIVAGIMLLVAILAIGVATYQMMSNRPMMHDDLNYMVSSLQWVQTHSPSWLRFPTHMAGSWLEVNGRMGELTTVIFYAMLPRWVHIGLCAIMMMGLYVIVGAWVHRGGGRLIAFTLSLIFLYWALPWWDNFNLFIMQQNYVWGATLSLSALWVIVCVPMSRRIGWLWLPVMFIAGMWHEAAGVPIAAGLMIYWWCNRKSTPYSRINTGLGIAFILGAIASALSPGIISRAGGVAMPDERLWYMLVVSLWCVGLLLVAMLIVAYWRPEVLRELYKSEWGIFVISAFVGAGICAVSGSYGRTGWFAQISAWIALCGLICRLQLISGRHYDKKITGRITSIFSIIVSLCTICSAMAQAAYQSMLNHECKEIIKAYNESIDGIVYCDYTTPDEHPAIFMGRSWGWIGPYDNWNRYIIERTYSGSAMKPITILPEALRGLNRDIVYNHHKIGGGGMITYPAPVDSSYNNTYDFELPTRVFAFRNDKGEIYYRQQFYCDGVYGEIDLPAHLAPGERYPNINGHMKNPPRAVDVRYSEPEDPADRLFRQFKSERSGK